MKSVFPSESTFPIRVRTILLQFFSNRPQRPPKPTKTCSIDLKTVQPYPDPVILPISPHGPATPLPTAQFWMAELPDQTDPYIAEMMADVRDWIQTQLDIANDRLAQVPFTGQGLGPLMRSEPSGGLTLPPATCAAELAVLVHSNPIWAASGVPVSALVPLLDKFGSVELSNTIKMLKAGHKLTVSADRVFVHDPDKLIQAHHPGAAGTRDPLVKAVSGLPKLPPLKAPGLEVNPAAQVAPTNAAARARWVPPGTRKVWRDRIMMKGKDGKWHMIGRVKPGGELASRHGLTSLHGEAHANGRLKPPPAPPVPGPDGKVPPVDPATLPPPPIPPDELRHLLLEMIRVHKALAAHREATAGT